jgi:diguanylate cyclase (GGDEF)-like protein
VLDETGCILHVNASWRAFAVENGLEAKYCSVGVNYLQTCDLAHGDCAEEASLIAAGIRQVLHEERERFYWEYPCHSPTEQRWFAVRISRFAFADSACVVVSHDNITQRKLAELQVQETNRLLAITAATDGLTGVPNRRHFDRALQEAWEHHRQHGLPVSLAMIDIDCFKPYNDNQGHLAGDDCLKQVVSALQSELPESRHLIARYGGEEFAVILRETEAAEAERLLHRMRRGVRGLGIPHPTSSVPCGEITVSIGGGTFWPREAGTAEACLQEVDEALYRAKAAGRDQTQLAPPHAEGTGTSAQAAADHFG